MESTAPSCANSVHTHTSRTPLWAQTPSQLIRSSERVVNTYGTGRVEIGGQQNMLEKAEEPQNV